MRSVIWSSAISLTDRPLAFVSTLFLLNQISALPGLVTSLLVGHYLLAIPFSAVAIAFPIALLASASLTVVGAAVGSLGSTFGG